MTIDLSGTWLVAHLMWAPVGGAPIERDLRIRFLNGRAQEARPDSRDMVPMVMFSENRLARRNVAEFGGLRLPADDYTFEFYLDG